MFVIIIIPIFKIENMFYLEWKISSFQSGIQLYTLSFNIYLGIEFQHQFKISLSIYISNVNIFLSSYFHDFVQKLHKNFFLKQIFFLNKIESIIIFSHQINISPAFFFHVFKLPNFLLTNLIHGFSLRKRYASNPR